MKQQPEKGQYARLGKFRGSLRKRTSSVVSNAARNEGVDRIFCL